MTTRPTTQDGLFEQVVRRERALREVREYMHRETTPEIRTYLHDMVTAALEDKPWPASPEDRNLAALLGRPLMEAE